MRISVQYSTGAENISTVQYSTVGESEQNRMRIRTVGESEQQMLVTSENRRCQKMSDVSTELTSEVKVQTVE
jgi:hypothetical protein